MSDNNQIGVIKKYNYLRFLQSASRKVIDGSYPHQIFIEVSSACNYRCKYCVRSSGNIDSMLMDVELYDKIIKEMHDKAQFIHYYLQGEPLINKNICEMIEISNEYAVDDTLATNTSLLTKDVSKKFLKGGLEQIIFSVTGATKDIYEDLHPGGEFRRVLENMLDFFFAEIEADIIIRTRSIFVKDRIALPTLDRYEKMFSLLPIDKVSTSELINWFGHNDTYENMPNTREGWKKLPTCTAPWRMMGISANGDVRACFIDTSGDSIIGNVRDDSVMGIWNGEKMQEFRRSLIERDLNSGTPFSKLCSNCNSMLRSDCLMKGNGWPYDLDKEVKTYFASNEDYYGYRRDVNSIKAKMNFVMKHGARWVEQMVNPMMTDDEFVEKYAKS